MCCALVDACFVRGFFFSATCGWILRSKTTTFFKVPGTHYEAFDAGRKKRTHQTACVAPKPHALQQAALSRWNE